MGELETVAPIFTILGIVLILGYVLPWTLGKIDDFGIEKTVRKNKQFKDSKPQWKCICGSLLINHGCYACITLNDANVQAWCPDCLDHPKDPIAC